MFKIYINPSVNFLINCIYMCYLYNIFLEYLAIHYLSLIYLNINSSTINISCNIFYFETFRFALDFSRKKLFSELKWSNLLDNEESDNSRKLSCTLDKLIQLYLTATETRKCRTWNICMTAGTL